MDPCSIPDLGCRVRYLYISCAVRLCECHLSKCCMRMLLNVIVLRVKRTYGGATD